MFVRMQINGTVSVVGGELAGQHGLLMSIEGDEATISVILGKVLRLLRLVS